MYPDPSPSPNRVRWPLALLFRLKRNTRFRFDDYGKHCPDCSENFSFFSSSFLRLPCFPKEAGHLRQVMPPARISNLPIAIPAHVRFAEVGMDCSLPYATYSYKGAACNIVTMLTNADSLSPFEISSLSLSLSLCSSRGAPHGAYTGRILPT